MTQTEPMLFSDLCDDIIGEVFRWLTPNELLSVEGVNKTWQRLVKQSLARVKFVAPLHMENDENDINQLMNDMNTVFLPQDYFDQWPELAVPSLDLLLNKCPNVRTIDTSSLLDHFVNVHEDDLLQVVSRHDTIDRLGVELSLVHSYLDDRHLQQLMRSVGARLVHLFVDIDSREVFTLQSQLLSLSVDLVAYKLNWLFAVCRQLKSVRLETEQTQAPIFKSIEQLDSSVQLAMDLMADYLDQDALDAVAPRVDQLEADFSLLLDFGSRSFDRLTHLTVHVELNYVENFPLTANFSETKHLVVLLRRNYQFNFSDLGSGFKHVQQLIIDFNDDFSISNLKNFLKSQRSLKRMTLKCNSLMKFPVEELQLMRETLEEFEYFGDIPDVPEELFATLEQIHSLRRVAFELNNSGPNFGTQLFRNQQWIEEAKKLNVDQPQCRWKIVFNCCEETFVGTKQMIADSTFCKKVQVVCYKHLLDDSEAN